MTLGIVRYFTPFIATAAAYGVYNRQNYDRTFGDASCAEHASSTVLHSTLSNLKCTCDRGIAYEVREPSGWSTFLAGLGLASNQLEVELPVEKLTCKRTNGSTGAYQPVVLVSCGSFNPPTIMHLRMFDLAQQALQKEGRDVLCGFMSPVHDQYGKSSLIPSSHRIAMCQLAADTSPLVMVDTWEASQHKYTRTLQVLRRVSSVLNDAFRHAPSLYTDAAGPKHNAPPIPTPMPSSNAVQNGVASDVAEVKAMLLCGGDVLESMMRPGVWLEDQLRTLLKEHGVVCVTRHGSASHDVVNTPGSLLYEYRHNIRIVEEPVPNDISSSRLREQLRQGACVRYLTPDAVRDYIHKHKLYVS